MSEISGSEYGKKQENHYSKAAKDLHGQILTAVDFSTLEARPTYIVSTSRGEQVRVTTFLDTDIKNYQDPYPELHRNSIIPELFQLAFNGDGELVGHLWSQFRSNGKFIQAVRRTTTAQRDKGYATPLELAHLQELQALADRSGLTVLDIVINENLSKLEAAKMGMFSDTPETIAQLEEEQKRWMELYGSNGRFGYEDLDNFDRIRRFFPNEKPHLEDTAEIIELRRFDTTLDDQRKVTGSLVERVEYTQATQQERTAGLMTELRSTILPHLEALSIPPHLRKNM